MNLCHGGLGSSKPASLPPLQRAAFGSHELHSDTGFRRSAARRSRLATVCRWGSPASSSDEGDDTSTRRPRGAASRWPQPSAARSALDRWRGSKQEPPKTAAANQPRPAASPAQEPVQDRRNGAGSGSAPQSPVARKLAAASGGSNGAHSRASAPAPQHGRTPSPTPQQPFPQPGADVLLELRDVWKGFGSKDILRGASMQIRRGEAVGIIGGSGTGKSTTLRLMAGLLAPDRGQVVVQGVPRRGLASDNQTVGMGLQIGMVFQSGALFDSLTVGENVGFLLYEHSHLPEARIKELVARSLAQVGLSGVESLMPAELSGGMRKRVALARAIIRDEEHDAAEQVIMYDEPTAGLDPVASTVVEDLIRSLHNKDSGGGGNGGISSYIVVTHQHSTIRRAVDRLIFLHEGSVVWTGSVEEFETTEVPIVAQFRTGSLKGPICYE